MKFQVKIDPAYAFTHYLPLEWNFTGRIKYEKYSNRTNVYFEVEYSYTERLSRESVVDFFRWLITCGLWNPEVIETQITDTDWLNEEGFSFKEIPEITIVECEQSKK